MLRSLALASCLLGSHSARVVLQLNESHASQGKLTTAGGETAIGCVLRYCLAVTGLPEQGEACSTCLLTIFTDSVRNYNVGPNSVPAGYWVDMIKLGLANTITGAEDIFCNGDMYNCPPKQNYPGEGSTSIMGWDEVSKMQRETVQKTWSGEWWRGGELGYLINNPYFWSGQSNRNDPIGLTLGITAKQHAVIRPALVDIFSVGERGSERLQNSTATIRNSMADYLKNHDQLDADTVTAMVYKANMELVFKRTPSEKEIARFAAAQSAINLQSLISQILPAVIYDAAFSEYRNEYTYFFELMKPMVESMYGHYAKGADCSPAEDCIIPLTQGVMDGFFFAGGLSVATDLSVGLGLLYSTNPSNPFPQRKIPEKKELNFFWETMRLFAPVMGFPHWEKRPTCPGLTDVETAALNKPDGQTEPCPQGETNSQTQYPEMNQYTGGARVIPNILLAQRDPKKWGPDASQFVIRDLSVYIQNDLGFADHAKDYNLEGGNHNMYCPGKNLALVMGEEFFKIFDTSAWVANAPDDIVLQGSPIWISGLALRRAGTAAPPRDDGLCMEKISKSSFASESKRFCDPDSVAKEKRLPEKLQGMFWLKDLPLPDVAACFSNGEWDAEKLQFSLPVLENFVHGDDSDDFVKLLRRIKLYYVWTFSDASLTSSTLEAYSSGDALGQSVALLYRSVLNFDMTELPADQPGDRWDRPSTLVFQDGILNRYEAWRILDGNLQVNEKQNAAMVSGEPSNFFYRYWESIDGQCWNDVGVRRRR